MRERVSFGPQPPFQMFRQESHINCKSLCERAICILVQLSSHFLLWTAAAKTHERKGIAYFKLALAHRMQVI